MFSCAGRWTLDFGGILMFDGRFVGGHWGEKDSSDRGRRYRFWLVERSLGAQKVVVRAGVWPAGRPDLCFSAGLVSLPVLTRHTLHFFTSSQLSWTEYLIWPPVVRSSALRICRSCQQQHIFTMGDAVVGIIGMGDMGKMYTRRLSEAGWR